MTEQEAKKYVGMQNVAPDDLVINKKPWKLEGTYLTRGEAMGSAGMISGYKLFKYFNGYALYERRWD